MTTWNGQNKKNPQPKPEAFEVPTTTSQTEQGREQVFYSLLPIPYSLSS
jgi:hypothetical protein